jgi:hypothetical protein
MPKSIKIVLTSTAGGVGPLMDLRSDADGFSSNFESNIPLTSFAPPNGYLSVSVPDAANTIRVYSNGICTNFLNLPFPSVSVTPTPTITPTVTPSLIPWSPRITQIQSMGSPGSRIIYVHIPPVGVPYFGYEVERRTGAQSWITTQPWSTFSGNNNYSNINVNSIIDGNSLGPELIQYRVRIKTSNTPTYSAWSIVPDNKTTAWQQYTSRIYALVRVSNNQSTHCGSGVLRAVWLDFDNPFGFGESAFTTPWAITPAQVLTGFNYISIVGNNNLPGGVSSGQIFTMDPINGTIGSNTFETCVAPNLPPYI